MVILIPVSSCARLVQIEHFPKNFIFRLTEEETDFMVSQNAIPSKKHLGGYLPYVFTELCKPLHNSVYANKKIM